MRRTYIIPDTKTSVFTNDVALCGTSTGVTGGGAGSGTGYGGVDDGTHDPDVKERNQVIYIDDEELFYQLNDVDDELW